MRLSFYLRGLKPKAAGNQEGSDWLPGASVLYSALFREWKNLGYDGTFCQLVKRANGTWLVFTGDDDEFVPGAFDKVLSFLGSNTDLGYVLNHTTIYVKGIKKKHLSILKNQSFSNRVLMRI